MYDRSVLAGIFIEMSCCNVGIRLEKWRNTFISFMCSQVDNIGTEAAISMWSCHLWQLLMKLFGLHIQVIHAASGYYAILHYYTWINTIYLFTDVRVYIRTEESDWLLCGWGNNKGQFLINYLVHPALNSIVDAEAHSMHVFQIRSCLFYLLDYGIAALQTRPIRTEHVYAL
jgi:hypothetical protein